MVLTKRLAFVSLFGLILVLLDFFLESSLDSSFNHGAGFGISFFPIWFIVIASIIILGFIFFFFLKSVQKNSSLFVWQAFLFFGGFSNLIDRIRFGGVNDYWNFFGIWSFNLPDAFLVLGIGGWVLISLSQSDKVKEL